MKQKGKTYFIPLWIETRTVTKDDLACDDCNSFSCHECRREFEEGETAYFLVNRKAELSSYMYCSECTEKVKATLDSGVMRGNPFLTGGLWLTFASSVILLAGFLVSFVMPVDLTAFPAIAVMSLATVGVFNVAAGLVISVHEDRAPGKESSAPS